MKQMRIGRRRAQETPASRGFVVRFREQKAPMVALFYLVILVAAAILAGPLSPAEPTAQNLELVMADPSLAHPLGTDQLGRDVLSRMLHAAQLSLMAGAIAVSLGLVVGVPIGLLAGYAGGRTDRLVMFVTDTMMGFPPILLAIGVVAALGPSITNAMIAVGIIFIPRTVRVTRGAALAIRNETYLEASRSIGTPTGRILRTHVLPNVLPPVIVQATLMIGFAMLSEASLSFLGLGAQPPEASWGSMLASASRDLDRQPLLMIWPGLAIAVTVLALNVLGDGLRDSFGREVRRG
ncbi:ABC transporter permease [Nocardioides sp. Bht2]|uniref:ABC transporter permease n=1 Tax=Nocardioides sp. Bht2 TaxID=3392297 RepID=UPI0039B5A2E5